MGRPDWRVLGPGWPNREASEFVAADDIRWHVQRLGDEGAPVLLLLHGTGASTHSFRDLGPILARRWQVVMPDLPGHGFTDAPGSRWLTLPGMAKAVAGLLDTLSACPAGVIGHSAGAAVAIRMRVDGLLPRVPIVGLNAALRPIQGNAILSPLAKILFLNPVVPRLFAWRAGWGDVTNALLKATGSRLDEEGRRLYRALLRERGHVEGALGMMAGWDLDALQPGIRSLDAPLRLLAARDDRMVPAEVSRNAAQDAPNGQYGQLPDGGHLVHETDPEAVAAMIEEALVSTGETALTVNLL